ncbi:hypothetical protein LIER_22706 [Lithospermum erythrorhizon]|uniref:Uncharacterized protein n=1 Tax=Lithospermum erythrorhizon TaxID=34254 RepID=A0AAV3QXV2_LITER
MIAAPPRAVLEVGAAKAVLLLARSERSLVGSIPFWLGPPQLLVLQVHVPGVVSDLAPEVLELLLQGTHPETLSGQFLMQVMSLPGQKGMAISQGTRSRSREGFGDKAPLIGLTEVEGEADGEGQAYFTPPMAFALLGGWDNLLRGRLVCAMGRRRRFLGRVKKSQARRRSKNCRDEVKKSVVIFLDL